jgi:hypothetical protein
MVIVVMLLAGFLVLVAFLLDVASSFVTRARLLNMADSSVDAGMAVLSDLIIERAVERNPNPPAGTNPLSVLTEGDRSAIVGDARVRAAVVDYVERNRSPYGITLDATDILYPKNTTFSAACTSTERKVELEVTVRDTHPFFFSSFLNTGATTSLAETSTKSIQLCP